MRFHFLDIPTPLKGYIQSFWKLEKGENDSGSNEFKTMADGSPGLIFQHLDKGSFHQNEKPLPPLFLYGAATKPNTMRLSGEFNTVGIFFTPHALKTIFGLGANELTDTCIDLTSLKGAHTFRLLEKLANSSSAREQLGLLATFIEIQVQTQRGAADEMVLYAVTQILSSHGSVSLDEITSYLRISERSLERKFKEHVGVAPKLFSRICRFQASLQQMQRLSYDKLSDIAFENEYADQSHFIRSFKQFSGLSPYQFMRQTNPLPGLSSVVS